MDTELLQNLSDNYREICQGMNAIYEGYAKSLGMSYSSLHALSIIAGHKNCTQKNICQQTMLPKQTVHAIVTCFWKQGLVELQTLPTDRRNKAIVLTRTGREYVEKIFPKIRHAQRWAMEQLGEEQRSILLELTQKYANYFYEFMLGDAEK